MLPVLLASCEFEDTAPWYESRFKVDYEQVDRVGLPHLDEVFFGDAALTEIREGDPATDDQDLQPLMEDAITVLRGTVENIAGIGDEQDDSLSPAELADTWSPNAVFVDLDEPISSDAYNGRPITGEDSFDQVISDALGRFLEDQVAVIDRGIKERNRFPYLVPPRGIGYKEDPAGTAGDDETEEE